MTSLVVATDPASSWAAVALGIGYTAWMTNAEWGWHFGDAVFATGDALAIRYLLADGGEIFRCRYFTERRKKARHAMERLAANGLGADERAENVALGFEFTVSSEGHPPVPLRSAKYADLVAGEQEFDRQIAGLERNRAIVRRAKAATEPYPDQTVEGLVDAGLLSWSDLLGKDERTA